MRMKNATTGIVVSVFDASGANLGPEWEVITPAEEVPEEVAPPKKKKSK